MPTANKNLFTYFFKFFTCGHLQVMKFLTNDYFFLFNIFVLVQILQCRLYIKPFHYNYNYIYSFTICLYKDAFGRKIE